MEQNGTSKNQTAPVNPCPEGWNAPTEAQMKRIMEQENWTCDKSADLAGPDYFYWNMRDGGRSDCEIFGATRTNPEIRPWSCENARQCAAAGVAHAGQPQFQSERQGFECGP